MKSVTTLVAIITMVLVGTSGNAQQIDWRLHSEALLHQNFQSQKDEEAYVKNISEMNSVREYIIKSRQSFLTQPEILAFHIIDAKSLDDIEFFESEDTIVVNNHAIRLDNGKTRYKDKREIARIINSTNEDCFAYLKLRLSDEFRLECKLIINICYLQVDDNLNIVRSPQFVSKKFYVANPNSNHYEEINPKYNYILGNTPSTRMPIYVLRDTYKDQVLFCRRGTVIGYVIP